MSHYYLDASGLVKRYVNEIGSPWIRSLLNSTQTPLVFTSRMSLVEVISAFTRRLREADLTSDEFIAARDMFRADCVHEYHIMPPSIDIVLRACELLECHPLRAYDATQLATALYANSFLVDRHDLSLTFVSADRGLNIAANAEGLAVDNPNEH